MAACSSGVRVVTDEYNRLLVTVVEADRWPGETATKAEAVETADRRATSVDATFMAIVELMGIET